MHHKDAVGEDGREIQIVQDGEDRAAFGGELARARENETLMREVERRRRLIQQQMPRAAVGERMPDLCEHAGEVHAVEFAAGERTAIAQAQLCDVGCGHSAFDRGAMLVRRAQAAMRVAAEFDHIADAEREGERRRLRQHGALLRLRVRVPR